MIFIDIVTLFIAFAALLISIQSQRNGLREKVFEEQFRIIRELMEQADLFSQYIDYDIPPYIRKNMPSVQSVEGEKEITAIYIAYDRAFKASLLILPTELTYQFRNLLHQMTRVMTSIGSEHYEGIREGYFLTVIDVRKLITRKFHISKAYKENEEIWKN